MRITEKIQLEFPFYSTSRYSAIETLNLNIFRLGKNFLIDHGALISYYNPLPIICLTPEGT